MLFGSFLIMNNFFEKILDIRYEEFDDETTKYTKQHHH